MPPKVGQFGLSRCDTRWWRAAHLWCVIYREIQGGWKFQKVPTDCTSARWLSESRATPTLCTGSLVMIHENTLGGGVCSEHSTAIFLRADHIPRTLLLILLPSILWICWFMASCSGLLPAIFIYCITSSLSVLELRVSKVFHFRPLGAPAVRRLVSLLLLLLLLLLHKLLLKSFIH